MGPVSLRGIVSQFDDFNANLCTGYQLMPRNQSDFNLGCLVAIEEQSWGNVKQRYRN